MICSKFITFAVTKTTGKQSFHLLRELWFAQNSLPLRWQRQRLLQSPKKDAGCDLLKIHYLCGDKDNIILEVMSSLAVVICSKFITFAVTKTTTRRQKAQKQKLWFAQNSLPLRWQRQPNNVVNLLRSVVICSKFITFAVTKTTLFIIDCFMYRLWFAQNSLPLRWQRQRSLFIIPKTNGCDLLKIHYLCGDKDNKVLPFSFCVSVVICSKFITFAVTKTTLHPALHTLIQLWFAQNSLPLRWQRQL